MVLPRTTASAALMDTPRAAAPSIVTPSTSACSTPRSP
jgi:hypothetical protein